jgi:hypothetical protein
MVMIARGLRLAILLPLALLPAAGHAEDCDKIIASKASLLMRGSSVMIFKGAMRPGLVSFRIMREEDPIRILETVGSDSDPAVELLLKGTLLMRSTPLKSKQSLDYEYTSVEGTLTAGTEMRYTRLVKLAGEVKSTESVVSHIGETSVKQLGECAVEVIAIDSEVEVNKAPLRTTKALYAPQLGYYVKADSAGSAANSGFAYTFAVTSLELAP